MLIPVPSPLYKKLKEIADELGVSVEVLILAILINMVMRRSCSRG